MATEIRGMKVECNSEVFQGKIQWKFRKWKKNKIDGQNTIKVNEKQVKQGLGTLAETDPECCVAHPLGCMCCFCCCLIRRLKKRKKKATVDSGYQLKVTNDKGLQVELNFTPAVIEQPKPQHRRTVWNWRWSENSWFNQKIKKKRWSQKRWSKKWKVLNYNFWIFSKFHNSNFCSP